jgi:hypothetical protein
VVFLSQVLFSLPVNQRWLEQATLGLTMIAHASMRVSWNSCTMCWVCPPVWVAAMGLRSNGSPMPKESAGAFEEQVRAVGSGASADYPYFVEVTDGRTLSERLDISDRLPRVSTDTTDEYHVYRGDEALEKQDRQ